MRQMATLFHAKNRTKLWYGDLSYTTNAGFGEIRRHRIAEKMELIGSGAMQSAAYKIPGIDERLQVIALGAMEPLADFQEVLRFMEFPDDGSSEFVVDAAGHDEGCAFRDLFSTITFNTNGHRIFFRGVFYIHGNVVDEAVGNKLFESVWEAAVGVKFYQKTHTAYFRNKLCNVMLEQWLTATYTNTVQLVSALFHKGVYLLRVKNLGSSVWQNQIRVLTEWTAKIAAAGKNCGAEPLGIVEK